MKCKVENVPCYLREYRLFNIEMHILLHCITFEKTEKKSMTLTTGQCSLLLLDIPAVCSTEAYSVTKYANLDGASNYN